MIPSTASAPISLIILWCNPKAPLARCRDYLGARNGVSSNSKGKRPGASSSSGPLSRKPNLRGNLLAHGDCGLDFNLPRQCCDGHGGRNLQHPIHVLGGELLRQHALRESEDPLEESIVDLPL